MTTSLIQSSVKSKKVEKLSCVGWFGIESGHSLNQDLIENRDYLQVDIIAAHQKLGYSELSSPETKKNNLVSFNTQNMNCFFSLFETVKNEMGPESISPCKNTLSAWLKSGQIQIKNIAWLGLYDGFIVFFGL